MRATGRLQGLNHLPATSMLMDAAAASRSPFPLMRVDWRVTPLRLGIGLTCLALALRLIDLGTRPLWLDEAYSAWFSARGWTYLWSVVPTYEPHPPFYYSILKLWREFFGGGAIALRAFSVLLGTATVPVVIATTLEQERQDPTGRPLLRAAAAGFLVACSPMLVLLDQEVRPYPLLILAYAVAILGLVRLFGEFRSGTAGSWKSWFITGAATELALWAHGLGILYAACLAVALVPTWLTKPIPRERLIRGGVTAFTVALAYLPCLFMLASRTGDWGTGWLTWKPEMLLQLVGLYTVPGEALTAGSLVAAIAMLLLIKRALQLAVEKQGWTSERALILLWLGPPLLAAAISAALIPVFLPRTLAATLVPAYLAFSSALARSPSPRERTLLSAAIAITLIPTAVQVAARVPMEHWDEVGAFLRGHVARSDEVWLYPNDSALPLGHIGQARYRSRGIPGDYPAVGFKGPIRAGSPAVVSLSHAQAEAIATDPANRRIPVIWLVSRQQGLFDPAKELPSALSQVRRPGPKQEWGYITVQPYYAVSGKD